MLACCFNYVNLFVLFQDELAISDDVIKEEPDEGDEIEASKEMMDSKQSEKEVQEQPVVKDEIVVDGLERDVPDDLVQRDEEYEQEIEEEIEDEEAAVETDELSPDNFEEKQH